MAIQRYFTGETIVVAVMGVFLVGASVLVCCHAYNARATKAVAPAPAGPPTPLESRLDAAANPEGASVAASSNVPPASLRPNPVAHETESASLSAVAPKAPAAKPAPVPPASSTSVASAPLPPSRPADLGWSENASRPAAFGASLAEMKNQYDRFTAIYDLKAHTVYLPNGARLEAHSGLGDRLDDPRYVDEQDRGATPPHLYELTPREEPFHGVQALRLNPVGGANEIFGRVGLLAHTYMLGPSGDSNGCVSFKDYDAFLQAFQSGEVKRLAVVASL
jgi:hypothetical protein